MPDNSLVIYKSSAGSGKTYTLVMEYLKLVLRKPSLFRNILAITFTNKATEEMKTRIVEALVDLSKGKPGDPFLQAVTVASGISESEIPERAQKVLDLVLHDYGKFSVSTIDSFFSRMVRSLARELNLPLRFDIEMDTDFVTDEITAMMLGELSEKEVLRNWLREYVFDKLDNDKGWSFEEEIKKVAKNLFTEHYRRLFPDGGHPPETDFISALKKIILDYERQAAEISRQFEKVISENNLTVDDFFYKDKGPAGFMLKIGKKLKPDAYHPTQKISDASHTPQSWVSKSSKLKDIIVPLAESRLVPLAKKYMELVWDEYRRYVAAWAVLQKAYMSGIIGTLDEKLKEFRDENELLLISDNNLLLSRAISGQDAPFIYEKSGNRYSHFMLDEFQDTSTFQWNNLLPLIENSLGSGHFTLIVGDAKQSIYRWRGGNMNLLQKEINDHLKAFSSITSHRMLGANYRSREVIVNFNNRFFELAPHVLELPPQNNNYSSSYQPATLTQEWKKGVAGEGFVQIRFFEGQDEDVDEETGEILEKQSWQDLSYRETLQTIHKLYDSGFQPRDIAILTRNNSHALDITGFLLDHGITNIISPESMLLKNSEKILLLINALTFIEDPKDDIALAYMVHFILSAGDHNAVSMHEALTSDRSARLTFLPERFRGRLASFRRVPLYDLTEELTEIFGLNTKPDAYIQRFLDLVLEYTSKQTGSIREFLEWWEEHQDKESCSVIIPSNENAIRVMTIHKSKGLQFPVVIMPHADWNLKPKHDSIIWVSSEEEPFNRRPAHAVNPVNVLEYSSFDDQYLEEISMNYVDNLNLFYVACTRAEEQLYVFTCKPGESKKGEESIPSNLSRFIKNTIKSDLMWNRTLSERNEDSFESGVYSKPLYSAKQPKAGSLNLEHWISVPWHDRLGIAVNRNKILSSDPDVADTSYGLLFHDIVSSITGEVHFPEVINRYFEVRVTEPENLTRLEKDLSVFMKLVRENDWIGPEAQTLTETELLLPDGSILRPDRLIIKDNRVTVVDYKTGAPEEKHHDQVRLYAKTLIEMGYESVRMFLLYPSLEKVIEVNAA